MNFMTQLYVVVDGKRVQNPALSVEEFQNEIEDRKQHYISQLWDAAHAYEFAEINGTGTGLLTLGVLKGLPKSMAVQAWVTSIWDLYYKRKAAMTHEPDPKAFDFSVCGAMPYTIPELMEEALS